jgi:hypothetical protein
MISKHVIDAIREKVTDWTKTDVQICNELNAETERNPEPPRYITKPMVPLELFEIIERVGLEAETGGLFSRTRTPKSINRIADWPVLPTIVATIEAQNYNNVLGWLRLALQTDKLIQAEYDACVEYVMARRYGTETYPDPDYRRTISWAEIVLGRPATINDVAAARAEVEHNADD